MNKRTLVLTQALSLVAFFVVPSLAADDEALKKDLAAVIALQGLPCGKVVEVTELAKDDYAVSCEDKNEYRVYMNAEGRVVVEKRK
jgi:hypothetical protein